MCLFDDIERTGDDRADYSESHFPYLNRSGREEVVAIRAMLETWFSHYPAAHQNEFRARFRLSSDAEHNGAFFELFLHEMLLSLGCSIEIHPEIPGTTKRPEFRVTQPDASQFYLEARAVHDESQKEAAARKRTNQVYDAINEMDSPDFWISAEVSGAPESPVPTRKLKAYLAKQLACLDYDDVVRRYEESGFDDLPRWEYEHDGWLVKFFPIPKNDARGEPGLRPMGLRMDALKWVEPETSIRGAILEKAKRYGTPDLPFVIAINALGDHVDDISTHEALFGNECMVSRFPGDGFHASRKPNGVWTNPQGQYTRVSAVLIARKLNPWTASTASARLYHHPAASLPLGGVLTRLPRAIVVENRIEFIDGATFGEILGKAT